MHCKLLRVRYHALPILMLCLTPIGCQTTEDQRAEESARLDDQDPFSATSAIGCSVGGCGPWLDGVVTEDGFHQIRQGETVELIIDGAQLSGTTAVDLGPLSATLIKVLPRQIRAQVSVPHGFAAQPLALRVTNARGSASLPSAIGTTFHIVAPGAAPGGHGTAESPLGLCDDALPVLEPGDTLALAAGIHRCARRLDLAAGVHVVGAGVAQTILEGFGGFHFLETFDPQTSTIGGLTVRNPAPRATVVFVETYSDSLFVDGLAIEGGAATGIAVQDFEDPPLPRSVEIRNFHYRSAGTGVDLESRALIASSTFEDCAIGVHNGRGAVTVRDSTISRCATGALLRNYALSRPFDFPRLTILDTAFTDNATGLDLRGNATLDRVTIASTAGASACHTAIDITYGGVSVRDHSRIGCAQYGIWAGHGQLGFDDDFPLSVGVTDSEVVGPQVGIAMWGSDDVSSLSVRRSRVDGTAAAIQIADDDNSCDLGSPRNPGGNQLTSTGFAFRDIRDDPFNWDTSLVGTTLNGRSYVGQSIAGPAALAPDYFIASSNVTLQF